MNALKRRLTSVGNRVGAWMYRAFRGRLSNGGKAVHVLMITTPCRRTGPHSTCVRHASTPAFLRRTILLGGAARCGSHGHFASSTPTPRSSKTPIAA